MSTVCELSELPTEMCSHCAGLDAPAAAPERPPAGGGRELGAMVGGGFPARFHSVCAGCWDDIEPGDRITQVVKGYAHVECAT